MGSNAYIDQQIKSWTYHHHECRNPGGSPNVIFFSHRIWKKGNKHEWSVNILSAKNRGNSDGVPTGLYMYVELKGQ